MTQYLKDRYGLLINGEWVDAENGATFETHNPATGELLALCANASTKDVDRAVKAAAAAQPAWAAKSPAERANILLKIAYRFRRIISATSPAASAPMKAKQR